MLEATPELNAKVGQLITEILNGSADAYVSISIHPKNKNQEVTIFNQINSRIRGNDAPPWEPSKSGKNKWWKCYTGFLINRSSFDVTLFGQHVPEKADEQVMSDAEFDPSEDGPF